ncbi:MAG: tetratricopeptide repeat protein [Maricaulaceae bacterium]
MTKFHALRVVFTIFFCSISSVCFANVQPGVKSSAIIPTEITQAEDLFLMARDYHDGHGVTQNFQIARELYLKAASKGDKRAMLNLGYMEFLGQGQTANHQKARGWYEFAANLKSNDAKKNIEMMNSRGLGIPAIAPIFALKREVPPPKIETQLKKIQSEKTEKITPVEPAAVRTVAQLSNQNLSGLTKKDPMKTQVQLSGNEASSEISIATPKSGYAQLITNYLAADYNGSIKLYELMPTPLIMFSPWLRSGVLMFIIGWAVWLVAISRIRKSKQLFVSHFYEAYESDILVAWRKYKNPTRLEAISSSDWQNMMAALIAKFALKETVNNHGLSYGEKIKREASKTEDYGQMRMLSLDLVEDVQKHLSQRKISA